MTERRIVAIVLPELLCEIGNDALLQHERDAANVPLGVVMLDGQGNKADANAEPVRATSLLDAVNEAARRYGVRQGQTIAEARALVAHITVREVTRQQVREALGRIAEIALAFSPTVSIEVPDTVWLDVTGTAHLAGGEQALVQELCGQVRAIGHVVRVAVACGPLIARAFARWQVTRVDELQGFVIPSARTLEALADLPVTALPLDAECAAWLMRVGVFSIGNLAALPRTAAAARLGTQASVVLDLCEGRDRTPLVPYAPPRILLEENIWDEPVSGSEPLLFALRGLVARLSARLCGRGEAVQKLTLTIEHDRSIACMQNADPSTVLRFKLASPLWREEELRRVITSRIERTKLKAPSIGLRLETPGIVAATARQLDLSQVSGGVTSSCKGEDELPVLLAELYADIGQENVGVLQVLDAHRPEAKSALFPVELDSQGVARERPKAILRSARLRKAPAFQWQSAHAPTRLLPQPVQLDAALRVGATVAIDFRMYTIEKLAFEQRLDAVEWWTHRPIARDYVRLWLKGPDGGLEALVFVNRENGARFLQGVAD